MNPVLSLQEQLEVSQAVEAFDLALTDEIYDLIEYYTMEEDDDTLQTTVKFYSGDGQELVSIEVEDWDVAVAFLEDTFDLEDLEDIDYVPVPDDHDFYNDNPNFRKDFNAWAV